MIGEFAPSQVGEGAGPNGQTIVTFDEMSALTGLCLSDVSVLTLKEQRVLNAFGAAGSILISIYGVGYLAWFMLKRLDEDQELSVTKKIASGLGWIQKSQLFIVCLTVLIPLLTVPQFWGIFRLRGIQRALAGATSNAYVDNQWTFGQVVSVTIFAPVLTEVGYLLVQDYRQ